MIGEARPETCGKLRPVRADAFWRSCNRRILVERGSRPLVRLDNDSKNSVLVSPSAPRRRKRVIARRIARHDLVGRTLPPPRIRTVKHLVQRSLEQIGPGPRQSPQVRAGNADLLRRLANVPEMFRERSLDQSEIKVGATGGDHGRSTGQRPYLPNSLPNHRRSATNSAPLAETADQRPVRPGVETGGTALKKTPQAKYAMGGPTRRAKRILRLSLEDPQDPRPSQHCGQGKSTIRRWETCAGSSRHWPRRLRGGSWSPSSPP
jgi:hypothetical protein